jgi:hypothetical protein
MVEVSSWKHIVWCFRMPSIPWCSLILYYYGVVNLNTEKTEVKLCMLPSGLLVFLLLKCDILFYVIGQQ